MTAIDGSVCVDFVDYTWNLETGAYIMRRFAACCFIAQSSNKNRTQKQLPQVLISPSLSVIIQWIGGSHCSIFLMLDFCFGQKSDTTMENPPANNGQKMPEVQSLLCFYLFVHLSYGFYVSTCLVVSSTSIASVFFCILLSLQLLQIHPDIPIFAVEKPM